MKKIPTPLFHRMIEDVNKTEFARKMTALQKIVSPERHEVNRQQIYYTLNGMEPSPAKILLMSAILQVHPSKLFTTYVDEAKFREYKKIAKKT
jgi:hypothetical protein